MTMTTSVPATDNAAVVEQILSSLHDATEPQTSRKIFDRLDKASRPKAAEIETVLQQQADAGRTYRYAAYRGKANRFWDRPPEEYAQKLLLNRLTQQAGKPGDQKKWAMTKNEACAGAVANPASVKVTDLYPILQALVDDNLVYCLPPVPGSKTSRYSTRRPDPADYIAKAIKTLAEQAKRLSQCEVDGWEVLQATRQQLLNVLNLNAFAEDAQKIVDRIRLLEPSSGGGIRVGELRDSLDFQLAEGVDFNALLQFLAGESQIVTSGHHTGFFTDDVLVSTRPGPRFSSDSEDRNPSATANSSIPANVDQPPVPSQSDLDRLILNGIDKLHTEQYYTTGLVPIHALRAWIATRAGETAASHAVLDDRLKTLRGQNHFRLVAISDTQGVTEDQFAAAVPGVNETLFYVEPRG